MFINFLCAWWKMSWKKFSMFVVVDFTSTWHKDFGDMILKKDNTRQDIKIQDFIEKKILKIAEEIPTQIYGDFFQRKVPPRSS